MALDFSELQAIDFSLGAFIASAFTGLAANGPDNYIRFINRPVKEKIYRVDHMDAKELIEKIAADKSGAGSTATIPPDSDEYRPDLPVIGYYRKPGISNGDQISVSGMNIRVSGDGQDATFSGDIALLTGEEILLNEEEVFVDILTMPITLDYSVTFAAWDKPTLDKLILAWYLKLVRFKRARFIYPVKLGTKVISVPVRITDNKTVMFSDASMPMSEQRLLAVTTAITLDTQAIAGEEITPIESIEVWGITEAYIARVFDV